MLYPDYVRIIESCSGNNGRSPMGAQMLSFFLSHLHPDLDIIVTSAGTKVDEINRFETLQFERGDQKYLKMMDGIKSKALNLGDVIGDVSSRYIDSVEDPTQLDQGEFERYAKIILNAHHEMKWRDRYFGEEFIINKAINPVRRYHTQLNSDMPEDLVITFGEGNQERAEKIYEGGSITPVISEIEQLSGVRGIQDGYGMPKHLYIENAELILDANKAIADKMPELIEQYGLGKQ